MAIEIALGVLLRGVQALLDEVGLLLLELGLQLVEEELDGVVLRQAGDLVEGGLLLFDDLVDLALLDRDLGLLAVDVLGAGVDGLLAALQVVGALVDHVLFFGDAVLILPELVAFLADLLVRLLLELGGFGAGVGESLLGLGGGFGDDLGGFERGLGLLGLGHEHVGDGISRGESCDRRYGVVDGHLSSRASRGGVGRGALEGATVLEPDGPGAGKRGPY
jgi:hypothetical protein